MKPAPFAYHAPTTLAGALELTADLHDAVLLAGGQTLLPLLNMRLVSPAHVVDLTHVPELSHIRSGDDVRIGAMVRQHDVLTSPVVRATLPLLAHATRSVGQPQTRSRGTIGGCLAFGSNVAEMSVALLALDASVTLRSVRRARTLQLDQFFVDYLATALEPDEILVEVHAPSSPRTAWGFSELKLRGCDFPIVVCAAALEMDQTMHVTRARIAVGGAAPTPRRLPAIEGELAGRPLTREWIARVGQMAKEQVEPDDDSHAPAGYRRSATVLHLERALAMAAGMVPS